MKWQKKDAEEGIALMTETAEQKRKEEQTKGGLIIVEAKYGKLTNVGHIIDVTIPLQCLVKDSELVLHNTSKAYLPGFYNPCKDNDTRELEIRYLYRDKLKYVKVRDNEPLTLPMNEDKK